MNKLDKLSKLIQNIRNYSDDIIKGSIPILKQIETDQRIIEHIVKKYPTFNKQKIHMILNEAAFAYIADARKIRKEIDEFSDRISENDPLDESTTPYMASVWKGDMFDLIGSYALVELNNELEDCFKNMSVKTIVKNACDVIAEKIELDKPIVAKQV